jgi:CBS-domain-containing membrane protein
MRLDFRLLEGYKRRALYTFVWGFAGILIIGLAADITQRPYIFPSLGPSAIMLFGHPLRRDSSPSHTIFGHGIGALSGYFALWIMGLLGVPFSTHVGTQRVVTAAIALGLTCALTILLHAEHAPAGATTLIVALGILPNPIDFAFLMGAVVMLVILALVVNRAFAIEYPLWRAPHWVQNHDAELLKKVARRSRLSAALRRR